jgi:peptidoglycan hydrolase-like protein with peptidoglycan-binding domain
MEQEFTFEAFPLEIDPEFDRFIDIESYPGEPASGGSERIRWVQDCLNQVLGLQLPITRVMGPETRSAVRSFQRQQGLRVNGIVGPDTEDDLKGVCRGANHPQWVLKPSLRGLRRQKYRRLYPWLNA